VCESHPCHIPLIANSFEFLFVLSGISLVSRRRTRHVNKYEVQKSMFWQ